MPEAWLERNDKRLAQRAAEIHQSRRQQLRRARRLKRSPSYRHLLYSSEKHVKLSAKACQSESTRARRGIVLAIRRGVKIDAQVFWRRLEIIESSEEAAAKIIFSVARVIDNISSHVMLQ